MNKEQIIEEVAAMLMKSNASTEKGIKGLSKRIYDFIKENEETQENKPNTKKKRKLTTVVMTPASSQDVTEKMRRGRVSQK